MRIAIAALVLALGCHPPLPDGRLACSADSECPLGWTCFASRCYASPPDGSVAPVDAELDGGVPPGDAAGDPCARCAGSPECIPGLGCLNRCARGETCPLPADCSPLEGCVLHRCAECPPGWECTSHSYCEPTCRFGTACPIGALCSGSVCVDTTSSCEWGDASTGACFVGVNDEFEALSLAGWCCAESSDYELDPFPPVVAMESAPDRATIRLQGASPVSPQTPLEFRIGQRLLPRVSTDLDVELVWRREIVELPDDALPGGAALLVGFHSADGWLGVTRVDASTTLVACPEFEGTLMGVVCPSPALAPIATWREDLLALPDLIAEAGASRDRVDEVVFELITWTYGRGIIVSYDHLLVQPLP